MAALVISGLAILVSANAASAQGQTLNMPNMQFVGAPNMFDQNGHPNTQINSNLPNAFNWHPYMPGVAPQVGNAPQAPTVQIIPPSGRGGQSYPIIEYNTNGYYGGGYGGWSGGYRDGDGYNGGAYNGGGYYHIQEVVPDGYVAPQSNVAARPTQPAPTSTAPPPHPVSSVPVTFGVAPPRVERTREPEHRRHRIDRKSVV